MNTLVPTAVPDEYRLREIMHTGILSECLYPPYLDDPLADDLADLRSEVARKRTAIEILQEELDGLEEELRTKELIWESRR